MPITPLQTFAAGDTTYISKHNSNLAVIEAALNTVLARTATLTTVSNALALDALLGTETAFIGEDSYPAEIVTTTVQVGPGFAYRYASHTAVENQVTLVLSLSGNAPGSYYTKLLADGSLELSELSTDALWAIEWDGTTISSLTRLAPVVWGAEDWIAAQTSTQLADEFLSLVARLDAIEASTQATLVVPVSSATVTPAPADVMQAGYFRLTGTLTENRTVVVPNLPKFLVVSNECTGAYTVTVKTAAGTGIALSPGGKRTLYCNGTNVIDASTAGQYYCPLFWAGTFTTNEVIYVQKVRLAHSFPANMVGSSWDALTAPSGTATITIFKGATSVGTVTFSAGSTSGTVSLAGGVSFAVGDTYRFEVTTPSTLAGVYCSLLGSLG